MKRIKEKKERKKPPVLSNYMSNNYIESQADIKLNTLNNSNINSDWLPSAVVKSFRSDCSSFIIIGMEWIRVDGLKEKNATHTRSNKEERREEKKVK